MLACENIHQFGYNAQTMEFAGQDSHHKMRRQRQDRQGDNGAEAEDGDELQSAQGDG